ncbi:hypothetical protein BGZ68_003153 [Mortierella alpina]|nr:hypothetical protein BGZ68_003153 [Mortierella alpina]
MESDTSTAKEGLQQEKQEHEKPEINEPEVEELVKEDLEGKEPEAKEPEEEEETQDEPVTPDILAWRETIASTLTVDTKMRFYLRKVNVGVYVSCIEPLTSIPISSEDNFLAFLDTRSVAPGWYWVVFGVSLKDMDGGGVDNIVFEVMDGDINGTYYKTFKPCTAVVENEDIMDLPKDEFARLRVHRQVKVSEGEDDCLWVEIELEALSGYGKEVSFDLHYIELASPNFKSAAGVKDHVLWGEGKPDQFIRVGAQEANVVDEPIAIQAYDFSALGTCAATLYFTTGEAHIDVWDVHTSSQPVPTGKPLSVTTPLAHISFPVAEVLTTYNALDKAVLYISISCTGSQVVMGHVEGSDHAIPLSIFRCPPTAPADRDLSETWALKKAPTTCESLQSYFGYGYFHTSDLDDVKAENERCFTFDGIQFSLYSTDGEWVQLYSIPLGVITDSLIKQTDMASLRESLRGRYFAWTGVKSRVSVWNFETGKLVITILTPEATKNARAALSEDGSMIAISGNGLVQIHDVVSRIKLGEYRASPTDINELEVVFAQDHFMAINSALSSTGGNYIDAHSIIRVHDMTIVDTHVLYWQYETEFPSYLNPVFAYNQTTLDSYYNTWKGQYTSDRGPTFDVVADYVYSRGSYFRLLTITNGSVNASISLGPTAKEYQGFFMASSSQLVLIMNGFLQIWRLPSEAGQLYELVNVEAFVEVPDKHANDSCITEVSSVQACKHGRKFAIALKPINWISGLDGEEVKDVLGNKEPQILHFPRTTGNASSTTEKNQYEKGIVSLLDTYADSGSNIKNAIVRFLINRIRPSRAQPVSSLVILCRSWKNSNRVIFENILTELLPNEQQVTWIPDINATRKEDPLSILVAIAKTDRSILGACMILMDYCVNQAIGSKQLSFLSPFLWNLKDIVVLFPDEARVYLRKIAYIPVSDKWRDYVVENSIVARPPWHFLRFRTTRQEIKDRVMQLHVATERPRVGASWRDYILEKTVAFSLWQYDHFGKAMLSLDKIKDLVLQLKKATERPRTKRDTFTRLLFIAAFDALWHYEDIGEYKESPSDAKVKQTLTTSQGSTAKYEVLEKKVSDMELKAKKKLGAVMGQGPTIEHGVTTKREGSIDQRATITQKTTWWKTLWHIFLYKLQLDPHSYVTCHAYSLDFFDNPAIAALVEYKWNTIGFAYWAYRFFFQCMFYLLVLAAALLQVYHENVGRAHMILFELRVLSSVSKYVTFIRQSVVEIRVFFFIFAGALINTAFMKSDATWRLIESRLHYIELAENLTYHIPGFRQTYNWFPKEIYFYATAQEIEEYREEALKTEVQNLKVQLSSQQQHAEQQFKEMKELLLSLSERSKTLEHSQTSEHSDTPVRSNSL